MNLCAFVSYRNRAERYALKLGSEKTAHYKSWSYVFTGMSQREDGGMKAGGLMLW